jgi:hypothetical protein
MCFSYDWLCAAHRTEGPADYVVSTNTDNKRPPRTLILDGEHASPHTGSGATPKFLYLPLLPLLVLLRLLQLADALTAIAAQNSYASIHAASGDLAAWSDRGNFGVFSSVAVDQTGYYMAAAHANGEIKYSTGKEFGCP